MPDVTHPSDMCVALAMLEAKVHVSGASGDRVIAFADFHRLPGDTPQRDTNLNTGEIITAVELPPKGFATNYTYLKIRDRLSYAFALVSVAAVGQTGRACWRAHASWTLHGETQSAVGRETHAVELLLLPVRSLPTAMLHVRICAGARGEMRVPTATTGECRLFARTRNAEHALPTSGDWGKADLTQSALSHDHPNVGGVAAPHRRLTVFTRLRWRRLRRKGRQPPPTAATPERQTSPAHRWNAPLLQARCNGPQRLTARRL